MPVHVACKNALIVFVTFSIVGFILFCHISIHLAFIVSQFLYSNVPIAINAVIAAITNPTGPVINAIAALKAAAPAPPALKNVTNVLIARQLRSS